MLMDELWLVGSARQDRGVLGRAWRGGGLSPVCEAEAERLRSGNRVGEAVVQARLSYIRRTAEDALEVPFSFTVT